MWLLRLERLTRFEGSRDGHPLRPHDTHAVEAAIHHVCGLNFGPLIEYDERRGSDLVGTLEPYFAAGASPSRAAAALHVHVNTVAQRLERVARLLGEGWSEPSRALELQLALRLHRLSRP